MDSSSEAKSHFERCKIHVGQHAYHLVDCIKKKKLNRGSFEGLINTFLEKPAYMGYPKESRDELKRYAMSILPEDQSKEGKEFKEMMAFLDQHKQG